MGTALSILKVLTHIRRSLRSTLLEHCISISLIIESSLKRVRKHEMWYYYGSSIFISAVCREAETGEIPSTAGRDVANKKSSPSSIGTKFCSANID